MWKDGWDSDVTVADSTDGSGKRPVKVGWVSSSRVDNDSAQGMERPVSPNQVIACGLVD